MRDFLVWQDAWLLEIAAFDSDHREIVQLLNNLAAKAEAFTLSSDQAAGSLNNSPASETFLPLFDKLVSHIRGHFKLEERFMSEIRFPGYQEHKSEHAMQVASFTSLRRSLTSSDSRSIRQDVLQQIKGWFLDHVASEDQRFAEFYFGNICYDATTQGPAEIHESPHDFL